MTDVDTRIACQWCGAQNPATLRSCDRCGAPLDVRDAVTASGWHQTPRIRDLTELHWSASACQIDTGVVPVADVELAEGDTVFFEHHVMLWKDDTVAMSVMSTPGGVKRLLSGMPFVLSVAHGPGHVAFSRDASGELVVLPVDPGVEIDVREHGLIMATGTLAYTFEKVPGLRAMLAGGTGMYLDRYTAQAGPGLLVLHGYGNVFQRTLGPGEMIQVDPGGFLYKDSTVRLEVESISIKGGEPPGSASPVSADAEAPAEESGGGGRFGRGLKGLKAARSAVSGGALLQAANSARSGGGLQGVVGALAGGGGTTMMCLTGPGRVGIQSMYQPHKSE